MMPIVIKVIWIGAVIAVLVSMVWFILGSTAFFNRGFDLVMTGTFVFFWIPASVFVVVIVVLLKTGKIPFSMVAQIVVSVVIVAIAVFFITTFFRNTNTYGWLRERVERNNVVQTTEGGRYEYELALINPYQRNSCDPVVFLEHLFSAWYAFIERHYNERIEGKRIYTL